MLQWEDQMQYSDSQTNKTKKKTIVHTVCELHRAVSVQISTNLSITES